MDFIGFDLGKVASQVCIITQDGELIERRIKTDREHLSKLLGSRTPARILIESSTESEWVARFLEELGHEVIVADPNFASMYATRSRKVKTDKRDARTLAEACKLGAYRPAHRTSDQQRHVRAGAEYLFGKTFAGTGEIDQDAVQAEPQQHDEDKRKPDRFQQHRAKRRRKHLRQGFGGRI